MRLHFQTKFNRHHFGGVGFRNTMPSGLLPNRVVPLEKIMSQFLSGRPVDANLERNLPYNDVPFNPLYQKGFDLCDLPDIADEVGKTLQETAEQVQSAQSQATVHNPETTPPEQVQAE